MEDCASLSSKGEQVENQLAIETKTIKITLILIHIRT